MELISLKQVNLVYLMICLLATFGLLIFSINRYCIDEDTTLIKITKFHSSEDAIYPSLSFCIFAPFLENKFDIYGDPGINMTSYIDFLDGKNWDDRFMTVEYDNVTVSLSDNLMKAEYWTFSALQFHWNTVHYVSFRSSNRKCFTINAPFNDQEPLWYFDVRIKNEIFPQGSRMPPNYFCTYLHFPGQKFTAYYTNKCDFTYKYNNSNNYRMTFDVQNVDVITRRNKLVEPCLEDWKTYDDQFMENKMNEIGCHPPHWKINSDLPLCSEAIQMKSFKTFEDTYDIYSFDSPCKEIYRLDYSYDEKNLTKQK